MALKKKTKAQSRKRKGLLPYIAILVIVAIASAAIAWFAWQAFAPKETIVTIENLTFSSTYANPLVQVRADIAKADKVYILEDFATETTGIVAKCGADIALWLGAQNKTVRPMVFLGDNCTDWKLMERPAESCLADVDGYSFVVKPGSENRVTVRANMTVLSGTPDWLLECRFAKLLWGWRPT